MARSVQETDMTEGNILKHILIFSIPLFFGNLIQQFYNLVDTAVVGKFVGDTALAATGSCGSIGFLFFSLTSGLAIGIGIIASNCYGAGDEERLRKTVTNMFYVLSVSAAVVTTLGIIFARPLLLLLSTPAPVMPEAIIYLRTTCCGILFMALYNGVAAILRAIGNSKMPLIFLIISSGLNIACDLLFVIVFRMGVFGVAFATVLAQGISAIISLIYAFHSIPYFRFTKEALKPDKKIIVQSFYLGIPVALQSSMIAISLMVLQGVVNSFDNTFLMDAFAITGKVDVIASLLYATLSAAFTTFAGQNRGAGKIDRIKKGYLYGIIITELYTLVIVPLVVFLSPQICMIFTDSPKVIELGTKALRISTWFYFALGIIYIPRGIMNGCGDARFALINGITEVLCRILYANLLILIPSIGMWGIWWACALTWITAAIVCNLRYFFKIRDYEKELSKQTI